MTASQELRVPVRRRPPASRVNSINRPRIDARRKSTSDVRVVPSLQSPSDNPPLNGTSTATQLFTGADQGASETTKGKANIDVGFVSKPVIFGPPELCYKLIGECYVDGLMDGQAVDLVKEEQSFKII